MKYIAVAFFLGCLAFAACQEDTSSVYSKVEFDLEKVDISTVEVASAKEATAFALRNVSKAVSVAFSDYPQTDLTLEKRLPYCWSSIRCPWTYKPVCAYSICRGLRTFRNRCQLIAYNRCNYPGYVELFGGRCDRFIYCRRRSFYDVIDYAY